MVYEYSKFVVAHIMNDMCAIIKNSIVIHLYFILFILQFTEHAGCNYELLDSLEKVSFGFLHSLTLGWLASCGSSQ